MRQTHSLGEKIGQFLIILLPILVTQISLSATGFFDTVMSGNVSHLDLAGVAIGVNVWLPIYTGINGILLGITPILAHQYGAGRVREMPYQVIQGLYLALLLTFGVSVVGIITLGPILDMLKLESEVRRIATQFLVALAFGMPPLFISAVLRNFIDSLGYTRATMMISLCALPINVALNYLLIFGNFGFPRLGGVGAGYASSITYWCVALISISVVNYLEPFKRYNVFGTFGKPDFAVWREQLRIGLPIGFAIFCEVSIFGVVALLMSEFGTAIIAAHQAAINFASLVYMVPLSIGMALTIVVGFEAGAKRYPDAKQYIIMGMCIALAIGVVFAIALSLFGEQVAGLYTKDAEVSIIIEGFLIYAIFFQLSDAIAAPIQGALRGYKDVRVTLVMAIVSYWVIGLPVGYVLAKQTSFGAYGYWIGFIAGLAVGATALAVRLRRVQQKLRGA